MKFYIFSFLLLLFAVPSFAQVNPKIEIGKPYPVVEFKEILYAADKSGLLLIKQSGQQLTLQKIGTDLALQKAMQYENFPKNFKIEKALVLKGKCYLLYSAKAKDIQNLFLAKVDLAKGELLDGGKEIVSPSDEIDVSQEQSYQFLLSNDSSHFAVSYRIKPNIFKSKEYEVTGVWTFNDQMTERWHAEFTLPYMEKKCKVWNRTIDNNGNVHLALRVINDDSGLERKMGQTTANYSIELLTYRSPSESPQRTPLKLENKFVNELSLDVVDNRLICSGLYNASKSDSDPEGFFAAYISSTSFHPFPLPLVNEGEKYLKQKSNERQFAKGNPLELAGLEITRTIPQPDGGMLILGEQHKEIIQTYHNPGVPGGGVTVSIGVTSNSTLHEYTNIIIARLLPDGKLAWTRKLLKGNEASSFAYKQKNNLHNFLFVEDDELIEYRLNDATGEGEKKLITKFKPLLKRPHALFTSKVGHPMLLPEGNGVMLIAHLSGDAGRFGETKPYKENVLVKVIID